MRQLASEAGGVIDCKREAQFQTLLSECMLVTDYSEVGTANVRRELRVYQWRGRMRIERFGSHRMPFPNHATSLPGVLFLALRQEQFVRGKLC